VGEAANDMGLTEKCYILAGVTPMKSVGMAKYMKSQGARHGRARRDHQALRAPAKGKQAAEGIKIACEQIEEFKEMKGVAGVHLMAIEWEHKVPEIAEYDGAQGIEKVKANPPDAIVLDVMMPEMDGYAVCKELKGDEKYADIPIVMLTAVASHVSSTRYSHYDGMSMEADDYLPKPASAEEISESLKGLLNL
jgi:two-component system alkaline phosphatase synthesis response regulator PhoP